MPNPAPSALRNWLAALFLATFIAARAVTAAVPFDRCVIVTPPEANAVVRFAAAELQKHVQLVSGVVVPVAAEPGPRFPIRVGIRPPGAVPPLVAEEARWQVSGNGAWLYGDDAIAQPGSSDLQTVVNYANRTGTLFAAYEFLERYLGIRWLEPGDRGIACPRRSEFTAAESSGSWTPKLQQRHIRPAFRDHGDPDHMEVRQIVLSNGTVPYPFILLSDEFVRRRDDERVWERRMRMGRTAPIAYGHAFTDWWGRYGQAHPEYFALNRHGQRAPAPEIMQGMPERIKLCVSNPDVVREVVRRHFAENDGLIVNACENDSRGFCRCERCLAWDALEPGEEKLDVDQRPLTDRYLRFANTALAEARKVNPAAKVSFYAYSAAKRPPRREKVADGVIVFFITDQFISDAELNANYVAWKAAGAKEVYLRPNYLCDDTGLPLGMEENMFEKLQLIRKHFALAGVDYDCSWGFYPITGLTEYITARSFYDPDAPFTRWEDEYYAAFGAARDDVRAYFQYWRQIWNQRVMPNRERINRLSGQLKETRDKLMQLTDLLYEEADFDRTDAMLAAALARNVSTSTRARLQQLQLANQHSRLTYRTRCVNELVSRAPAADRAAATQALFDFRRENRDRLNLYWEAMYWVENQYNDVGGYLRMVGRQGKRYSDWAEVMAESIRKNRADNEPPLR